MCIPLELRRHAPLKKIYIRNIAGAKARPFLRALESLSITRKLALSFDSTVDGKVDDGLSTHWFDKLNSPCRSTPDATTNGLFSHSGLIADAGEIQYERWLRP